MKTTLPLLLLLFVCASALGQGKFEKGYYITFQGDSVSTYINNEDWMRNPEAIEVKKDPAASAANKLTLQQIKRFGFIGGDTYETFAVDVDHSPLNLNNIMVDAPPTIVRDTVMLRSLVEGPVNLYVYTDRASKTHFYVQKGGEEPRELLYQRVKRTVNDEVTHMTLELYKGLLHVYFDACEDVKKRVDRVDFKQSQLQALVTAYNGCVNPSSVTHEVQKEKGHFRLGFIGGFSAASFAFMSGGTYDALVETDFSGGNATAGLALDYVLPRAHGKWTIANEVMLKPYSAEGHYEYRASDNNFEIVDTELKFVYVGIHNMLRYALSTGAIRPYINVGIANNLMVSENGEQQVHKKTYSIERKFTRKPLEEYRKYEQALLFGAGVSTNKLAAEFRAERGNGFSPYVDISVNKRAYTLQLTYFIR